MSTAAELAQGTADAKHLSQDAHRQLIGVLGLAMPFLVWLVAGIFPDDPATRWELLRAISAYWYTSGVGVFVGVLFALSLFLYTYRGYEGVRTDRIVGGIAGTAAVGVAVFPQAPGAFPKPDWWMGFMNYVHLGSAIVLFSMFALFSIWLFRLSDQGRRGQRRPAKRRRDDVCLVCGLVIIAAMLWALSSIVTGAPVFWPEALAVEAFGVSWLVKGQARVLKPFGLLD